MSGFGLWSLQGLRRGGSRFAAAVLCASLTGILLSCSSQPDVAQTSGLASTAEKAEAESLSTLPPLDAESEAVSPGKPGLAPPGALTALPSVAELVSKVRPTVASISVEAVTRGLFFDFLDTGAGSGTVVRPDGYIVTNYHVVQGAKGIKVNLPNGATYDATVVGRDLLTDLAVIKIDAEDLPTASFVPSDDLQIGDWVVAVGNALALRGGPTVTLGIVSARGRTVNTERGRLYDLIQTDAAINNGNSGGPLVNLNGGVVGINTVMLRQAQGIGFAISSSVANRIIASLIEHGRVARPLIGLLGEDFTPALASQLNMEPAVGIIVSHSTPNGPAYTAGIRLGDVITKIDGVPTPDMAHFLTLLWTYAVGDIVEVEYISSGKTLLTSVALAERPPD